MGRPFVALALALALALPSLLVSKRASADAGTRREVPWDLPRLIHDTGRIPPRAPDPDEFRFFVHGEFQLRYQAQRSFPLIATASAIAAKPGLLEQSIGQNQFVSHWLRLTPRLQLRDSLELVGQIDLVGLLLGDIARDTRADATPRDDRNGFSNVQPRWLYAQYKLPFGELRFGQQPNHWGMGIFANDGDHPTLFGDYRYGSISERIQFVTKPAGNDSDLNLMIAGDLVYRDQYAELTRGEQAFQAVLAAYFERGPNKLGVYSTLRHQDSDRARTQSSSATVYSDALDAITLDLHGRFATPLPGEPNAFLFGEAEAVYIHGSTSVVRTAAQALAGGKTEIRSYGGAVSLGVVHEAWATGFWKQSTSSRAAARAASASYLGMPSERGVPFGDLVAQVELGYASGDTDPYDGTNTRFVFDPNHRIGLLLFDEILRFQTARAATAATDPLLTNTSRVPPGIDALPSNGGVFGAQYINPTVIVRPRHWLDLKAGMVLAQATSDIVDPYRLATGGSYVNYRGGDARKKDLGIELDAGTEARFPLGYGMKAQVGAQTGVLFPGGALEDANGIRLDTQWIAVGRLGLLF